MRLFLARLKYLLRQRENVFWTFVFPLCLAIFFYMGFGKLSTKSSFTTIQAFVASDKTDANLLSVMESIPIDDEQMLFNINSQYTAEELEASLQEGTIQAYIYIEGVKIIYRLRDNGLNQTVTKSFLDQYIQTRALYVQVQTLDPSKIAEVMADMNNNNVYYEEIQNNNNPDTNAFIIYFYALIAMTCMFGSYWGTSLVHEIQANNSPLAARISVSPTHKMKMIIIHFLAALLIQYVGNLVLIAFLKYVLGVQFSKSILLVLLATLVGSIAGISMGVMLSALIRASYSLKYGIMTLISLALSALSGLMIVNVKYIVAKYVPFLSYINPASLLTDTFY
ncbi:MAG: ABC transporter permease, partial [Acholeplasmataceae bacterium]|nr:ABC transporter permease [Acholeplasmataceae bacterium]